jgi:hypothetical protein
MRWHFQESIDNPIHRKEVSENWLIELLQTTNKLNQNNSLWSTSNAVAKFVCTSLPASHAYDLLPKWHSDPFRPTVGAKHDIHEGNNTLNLVKFEQHLCNDSKCIPKGVALTNIMTTLSGRSILNVQPRCATKHPTKILNAVLHRLQV